MKKKVSVIIPTYNAEVYIKSAYKSVCKQSLKEIEIVFVDDGSSDGTLRILDEISKEDSRIRVFSYEHKGSGAARNYGLEKARGEYVAFLDADDEYVDEFAFEKMYSLATANKALAVAGQRVVISNEREYKDQLFRDIDYGDNECLYLDFADYQEDYHYQNYFFRRDFLIDNKIFFPYYLRYQDPVFCLKAMDKAKKVLVVPVELYKYRVGQQDQDAIERNISDCLRGILDNLMIADKRGYGILYRKLIARVNNDYHPYFFSNMNVEVMNLLSQILMLNESSTYKQPMQIMDIMSDVMRNWVNYALGEYYTEGMEKIISNNVSNIESYFFKRGIKTIAIYGAGKFGMKLLDAIAQSSVKVSVVADRNFKDIQLPDKYNVNLDAPENMKLYKYDAVVVTPIRYGNMAKKLFEEGEQRVFILKSIIDEVLFDIENE